AYMGLLTLLPHRHPKPFKTDLRDRLVSLLISAPTLAFTVLLTPAIRTRVAGGASCTQCPRHLALDCRALCCERTVVTGRASQAGPTANTSRHVSFMRMRSHWRLRSTAGQCRRIAHQARIEH